MKAAVELIILCSKSRSVVFDVFGMPGIMFKRTLDGIVILDMQESRLFILRTSPVNPQFNRFTFNVVS